MEPVIPCARCSKLIETHVEYEWELTEEDVVCASCYDKE
jgi:formylmethanofuran dehydrogenase subunit E